MINSHRTYLMPIDSTLMPDPTMDGPAKSCTISAGRNVTPGPSIHLFHSTSAKLGRVPDERPCCHALPTMSHLKLENLNHLTRFISLIAKKSKF